MKEVDWDYALKEAQLMATEKHPQSVIFSDKVSSVLSASCIYTTGVWGLIMLTIIIIAKVL